MMGQVRSPHEGLGELRDHPPRDGAGVRSPHEGLGAELEKLVRRFMSVVRSPHEGLGELGDVPLVHVVPVVRSPHEGLGGQAGTTRATPQARQITP